MPILSGLIPPLAPSGGGGYDFTDTTAAAALAASEGVLAADMVSTEHNASEPSAIAIAGVAAEALET